MKMKEQANFNMYTRDSVSTDLNLYQSKSLEDGQVSEQLLQH